MNIEKATSYTLSKRAKLLQRRIRQLGYQRQAAMDEQNAIHIELGSRALIRIRRAQAEVSP